MQSSYNSKANIARSFRDIQFLMEYTYNLESSKDDRTENLLNQANLIVERLLPIKATDTMSTGFRV